MWIKDSPYPPQKGEIYSTAFALNILHFRLSLRFWKQSNTGRLIFVWGLALIMILSSNDRLLLYLSNSFIYIIEYKTVCSISNFLDLFKLSHLLKSIIEVIFWFLSSDFWLLTSDFWLLTSNFQTNSYVNIFMCWSKVFLYFFDNGSSIFSINTASEVTLVRWSILTT